jgi:hypothetical protein
MRVSVITCRPAVERAVIWNRNRQNVGTIASCNSAQSLQERGYKTSSLILLFGRTVGLTFQSKSGSCLVLVARHRHGVAIVELM